MRGAPLFLRIFAVLLGCLVAVQGMNIALVFLAPAPAPRFYQVDQVARALSGSGADAFFEQAERGGDAVLQGSTPPETRLRTAFARRLGVREQDVRVSFRLPFLPPRFVGVPAPASRPPDVDVLFGDFRVARRLHGDVWRELAPKGPQIAFWRWRALVWLVAALLVTAPFAWLLARRVARPIAMFVRAAERLGREPQAPPILVFGPPEVAEAAVAFNEMQARLQRYVADRSFMLGAIAHDLRTPLMRVSLRLELAPAEIREPIEAEIADVQAMLTAILDFLRQLDQPVARHRLDIRALLDSVANDLVDEGHRVCVGGADGVVIEGDPPTLKAMISNLARNAVIHGGGEVRIRLSCDDKRAAIEILDDGPGIPPDLVERVFEPFVRVEASRSRNTGGIGLGLASARATARRHGGDVTLANRPSGGLAACVTLPI